MKKIILLILPFFLSGQISTAEYYLDSDQSIFYFDEDWKKSSKSEAEFYRIVKLNSNGIPIGEIRDYFKSGKIQAVNEGASLLDNNDDSNSIWEGKSTTYFETGGISYERFYINGLREGKCNTYYGSGSLLATWNAINDKVNGTYKEYYDNSGKIMVVENWDNGIQLDYTSYHENGNVNIIYKRENGKIQGDWKSFYDNGNREQEANFVNGNREGLLRNFDINGKLTFISKWRNNKKYFEETFYENGQLKSSYGVSYLEDGTDVVSGNYKFFDESGILKQDYNYNEKGDYDGQTKNFDSKGKIISVQDWVDGVSISEIRYHPITGKTILNIKREGDRIFEDRFPEGNNVWKWKYDKDWNTEDEVDGEFIPLYYRYQFFTGKTSPEPGSTIFNVTLKYEDGTPKLLYSVRYSDANYNSINKSKYYYDNGNVEQIISYNNNGERDGDTDYFNEDGSYEKSVSYKNGVKDLWNYKCDNNNQNCEYTYTSYFDSTEDATAKGWNFYDDDDERSFIPTSPENAKNKYYWEWKNNTSFIRTVTLPINDGEDFQFSLDAEWWTGVDNNYFGIVVGYKDWDNYTSLKISPNGYFKVEKVVKGINVGMQDGETLENKNFKENTTLNIVRVGENMYFSIDGALVYTSDFSSLTGDRVGFLISGEQSVVFDNVKLSKSISNTNYSDPDNNGNLNNDDSWLGNGTGIILTTDGYIATNYHVVEDVNEMEVEFLYNNQIESFIAEVIMTDQINDLAIIKINDQSFRKLNNIPYNFKTRSADVGEQVFALGYPMALSTMGKEIKFTDGRISAKSGFQGDVTQYQSTTPIQGGNSGGPLFDYNGNLIAINTAKLSSENIDNVSYSVKSSYLLSLIDALPQNITLPSSNSLLNQSLTQKIKTLTNYVVLIKTK